MDLELPFPPQFTTSLFQLFIFPCSLPLLSLSASIVFIVKLVLFPKPFILFSCHFLPFLFLNPYYYFRGFFNPLQFLSFLYLIPSISASVNLSKICTRGSLLISLSFRFLRYSLSRKVANRQVLPLSEQYHYILAQNYLY